MFLDFLKILFILLFTSLIIFKFARYDLVKQTFENYLDSLKILKKEIFTNPNLNIDSLQPKLNHISKYGIKLILRFGCFLIPYFFAVIILNFLIDYIPFGFIILLPSLSYLSLLRKI